MMLKQDDVIVLFLPPNLALVLYFPQRLGAGQNWKSQ